VPTLFFLPWVPSTEEIALGPVKLVPFERGSKPGSLGGIPQGDIDAILGAYAVPAHGGSAMGSRVDRATIVWWEGDSSATELTEDDIAERLTFGQTIAFAALSERRYGSHWYWNADCLAMVGQRFVVGDASRLLIQTRRRDGHGLNVVSASGAPVILRPHHVTSERVEFDGRLVQAIDSLPYDPFKERLLKSITVFNRANTDSADVSLAIELVLLRVAFETLFQSSHATPDLAARIARHFDPYCPKVAWAPGPLSEATWHARWPKDVQRPLDAWVQDFCAARNNSAHGPSMPGKHSPPVWSNANHALFASWLFPISVKSLLQQVGVYALTDMDTDYLTHCEAFLAHDVLALTADGKLTWDLVDDKIRGRELGRLIATGFNRQFPD